MQPLTDREIDKRLISSRHFQILKRLGIFITNAVYELYHALRKSILERLSKIFLKKKGQQRTTDPNEAREILRVRRGEKEQAIIQRSLSNKRISLAFLTENPFTTLNVETHDSCVKKIHDLIKNPPYVKEQALIKEIFETEKLILTEKYGEKIPFGEFVKIVTLKYSIKKFVDDETDKDISEKEFSELCLTAAEKITSLWIQSKDGKIDENDQKILFDILKKVFPNVKIDDKIQNPMGIILPSFETMWRVLYRVLVVLKCNEKSVYRKMLQDFGKDPSEKTFTEMKNYISVENIIKEVLFLYPPTRTIYRNCRDENNNEIIKAIDVLKMHEENKGDKLFEPERWANKKNIPFYTFGNGALSCPAKNFAPRALALMGATILEIFEEYEWGINFAEFSAEKDINDRLKYIEFYLTKIK